MVRGSQGVRRELGMRELVSSVFREVSETKASKRVRVENKWRRRQRTGLREKELVHQ